MGVMPLQNEMQLTMGESTCETTLWSIPSYFDGGKANFNIRSLMEVAMERCATARCAVRLMGDLAVTYGFYGVDGGPIANEAEALVIGKKNFILLILFFFFKMQSL
jgi:dipeptidase